MTPAFRNRRVARNDAAVPHEIQIDLDHHRILTPRLELVAATSAMLRAESHGSGELTTVLDASVPPSWPPELYDRDDVERMLAIAEASAEAAGWGLWYLIQRSPPGEARLVVGVAGFGGPPAAAGDVQLGYTLVPEARGRGYATEATRALLAFAFADSRVTCVAADTYPALEASIRVLEKAGFAREDAASAAGTIRFVVRRSMTGEGLAQLGWDADLEREFTALANEGLLPARVIAEHRDAYAVAGDWGEAPALLAGRLRHSAAGREELPAVGDWVGIARPGGADDRRVIRALLPRRGAFRRKVAGNATEVQVVAANVDIAFVVTALPDDLNPRRLERYLALVWESGAVPVIVLTKADLCADLAGAIATARAVAPGVDVVALSSVTGHGLDAFRALLRPRQTAVLLGSSGVGKSTLVNRLLEESRLRTGDVRDDGKGRHTTTHRQLVRLAGGALLIDTPGMRELQLWAADAGLEAAFADIAELARECRFADCRHEAEPGCAVRGALAAGTLATGRFENWLALQRELAYLARREDEAAAAKERTRVKAIMRAHRLHMKRKKR